MPSSRRASELATTLLARRLPERYAHVAGVASRVSDIGAALNLNEDDVVSAAWLHDVGYAREIMTTGFHALDGARYAQRQGFSRQVTSLIAHHSCARIEGELRGLLQDLSREFPEPNRDLSVLLTAADMTIGPGGVHMSIDERISDIRRRYGPDDVVHRFIDLAEPDLRAAQARAECWLAQSQ